MEAAADAAGARVKKKPQNRGRKNEEDKNSETTKTTTPPHNTKVHTRRKKKITRTHAPPAACSSARGTDEPQRGGTDGRRPTGRAGQRPGGGDAPRPYAARAGVSTRGGAVPGRLAASTRSLGRRPPRPRRLGKHTTVAAGTRRQGAEGQSVAWGGVAGSGARARRRAPHHSRHPTPRSADCYGEVVVLARGGGCPRPTDRAGTHRPVLTATGQQPTRAPARRTHGCPAVHPRHAPRSRRPPPAPPTAMTQSSARQIAPTANAHAQTHRPPRPPPRHPVAIRRPRPPPPSSTPAPAPRPCAATPPPTPRPPTRRCHNAPVPPPPRPRQAHV